MRRTTSTIPVSTALWIAALYIGDGAAWAQEAQAGRDLRATLNAGLFEGSAPTA